MAGDPPSPLLAVPNVTAHPSVASAPITILLHDGPLLCGFNVAIKGSNTSKVTQVHQYRHPFVEACGLHIRVGKVGYTYSDEHSFNDWVIGNGVISIGHVPLVSSPEIYKTGQMSAHPSVRRQHL